MTLIEEIRRITMYPIGAAERCRRRQAAVAQRRADSVTSTLPKPSRAKLIGGTSACAIT
ncbi:hypothetical protein GOFOIKOB_5189 [Methylobacterium tardum]|uniref:Uncharacterized protein n=1 Tax=Methylobacterium tardum TaxID=374432 RepID=A0AA37WSD9_9HYPH|nr:hypothetical protein [Methylobacterium tardum]URD38107.1 hypothetical protein M6G65_06415 [Methylobacterium tardum]GJE52121.1 hypothetical protein GOFOIKOB_5189 [Methylobacterium tardum]GLS71680.1 hypothetical protein GCM10007890_36930 [Methylobacterium tardum]